MNFFTKFLVSRVSGWIALLALGAVVGLGAFVTKQVYDYKELQRMAAYCEGRESMMDITRSLQERAIESVEDDKEDVIEELEHEREEAQPSEENPDTGCAAQRAPESILRYHGLRD